jgi:hypothetical protein
LAPASAKETVPSLQRLCAVYGPPPGWEIGAGIYLDVLREQPATVIDQAVFAYISATDPPNVFFPKPGQLLALCKELRWPFDVELENARAEFEWTKNPAYGRSKAQLMAECREMYGQYATALDTEWMLWHLGSAPPVPPPPERLSAEAKGAIEMHVSAELEAERRAARDAMEEAKRINQREGLPQMPLDQWSRKRRGIEAAAAIINRWREPEPTTQEK